MQCILYKIYFWKVFHMYYNLICTPMWTKFYSCKKWVLHCQSTLLQSPNELMQGLQRMKVHLSYTVPPVRLGDGAAIHEHGERHVGVVPPKEPYSQPPDRRVGHREVKVGTNSRPESDKDVDNGQSYHFRV
jgi:hypothetical protein